MSITFHLKLTQQRYFIRYIIIALVLPHFATAQGFQGKIIVGANLAQIDGDQYWGYNKIGLLAGAAASVPLSKKVGIQMEICYSGRGAASNSKYQPGYIDTRLHYIDFPLMLNILAWKKITIQPGLTPSYFIGGHTDPSGFGYYIDLQNYIKKEDLCFMLGAEYALDRHLAINMRFNYSLISVLKHTPVLIPYSVWYNNLFSISLRYTFIDPVNKE